MERALSQDERIRRAEEIYARRQNARERRSRATVNISGKDHKNFKLLKRLALQALICMLIYFIFYLINTTNYTFSKEALDKTEELISQEVDFIGIYNNIKNAVTDYISKLNLGVGNNIEQQIVAENVTQEENNQNVNTNEVNQLDTINVNSNEISQSKETYNEKVAIINNEENTSQDEIKDVEISETDRIKQKYSFIIPVKRMGIFRIWRKRTFFRDCIKIS